MEAQIIDLPDRLEAGREQILEAAAAAIATHGFHGMSMRDLARATGRSVGGFYSYFGSKDDVLLALHLRAFHNLIMSADSLVSSVEDEIDKLYLFVANHTRYVVKHTKVMRVLVTEVSALGPSQRRLVRTKKERYFDVGRSVIEQVLAASDQCVDASEVERSTYSLFGMLNWIYAWYVPKKHGTPADVARTVFAMAMRGLVARAFNEHDLSELFGRVEEDHLPSLLRRAKP